MCQTLNVSRSGFHDWQKRGPGKRDQDDAEILQVIKDVHQRSRGLFGLDKIHSEVKKIKPCSRKRVYRLMNANGISSKRPKKYKATANSKHNLPVAENLLNQDFTVEKPSTVWVSDISYISYIWTDEGWDYLATVKDLFNCWVGCLKHHDKGLSNKGVTYAIQKRRPPAGLIHHSDRGVQYCSKDYQALFLMQNCEGDGLVYYFVDFSRYSDWLSPGTRMVILVHR